MSKNQSFISVISVIDNAKVDFGKIEELQAFLESRYSDYELLLIVKKSAQSEVFDKLVNLLDSVPCIRYLQLSSDVTDDVALFAGLENAIGDFFITFDLSTDPMSLIEEAVLRCKGGTDIILGVSDMNETLGHKLFYPFMNFVLNKVGCYIPKQTTGFICFSRRAANAIMTMGDAGQSIWFKIQQSRFEIDELLYQCEQKKEMTFETASYQMIGCLTPNPLTLRKLFGLSLLVSILFLGLSLLTFSFLPEGLLLTLFVSIYSLLLLLILFFGFERLFTEALKDKNAYFVVYEKNSTVMIDLERINVMNDSMSSEDNKVQTSRNN